MIGASYCEWILTVDLLPIHLPWKNAKEFGVFFEVTEATNWSLPYCKSETQGHTSWHLAEVAMEVPVPKERLEEARPRARVVSTEEVVARIRDGVRAAGSQVAYARRHGVSEADLSNALRGHRPPTSGLMASVGARRALIIEERACG
ncbi:MULTISPECIES: hypothetical protein [Methylobacterium]|nr:hypothetical protein [Methylobacterium sp.]